MDRTDYRLDYTTEEKIKESQLDNTHGQEDSRLCRTIEQGEPVNAQYCFQGIGRCRLWIRWRKVRGKGVFGWKVDRRDDG